MAIKLAVNPKTIVIVVVVMMLVGLGLIALTYPDIQASQDAASWPTTDGVVLSTFIETSSDGQGDSYSPHIVYEYHVNAIRYESNRIALSTFSSNLSEAQSYIDNYPIGSTVTVHYNPNDPGDAVLETQFDPMGYLGTIIGIVLVCVGAAILALLILKRRGKS
jgi:hypothetical protein